MQIKNKDGELLHEVRGASLSRADLRWVDLSGANLSGVDLSGADLSGASLRRADLTGAILCTADLRWADLLGADLRGADLTGADLEGASLSRADLYLTRIDGAILPPPIVPLEGEFTGYKKVLSSPHGTYDVITLRIPAEAQRTSALTSRKCRASHVVVVQGEGVSPTRSESKLIYTPGAVVVADEFDADRREECTHGIHFFLTREEAEAYQP